MVVVFAVIGTVLDVVDEVTTEIPFAGPVAGRSRGMTTVAVRRVGTVDAGWSLPVETLSNSSSGTATHVAAIATHMLRRDAGARTSSSKALLHVGPEDASPYCP